jgi:N-acetylmannosamine-6-phosphate 2-epimerase/N-acetylmannosamine kinase
MTDGTILAADLGGTKTLAALVRGGQVLERRQIATDRSAGPDGWTAQLSGLVADWQHRFDGIGIAVTGIIEEGRWSALNPRTLPVPHGYPLAERVVRLLGIVPVLANDAQAAAWGEFAHGAGQGRDMAFVTVSTGIGGGLVLGGRLVTGAGSLAGSFGLLPDDGGAAVEDLASGRWIEDEAARAGHSVGTPAVFAAAEGGAAWADAILDASARRVARLCRAIQLVVDPSCIVIGGGVGLAGGYIPRIERHLDDLPPRQRPALARAALGSDAGIIGIAALATNTHSNREKTDETERTA